MHNLYVPSYHLPHSQEEVVQSLVNNKLECVIQEPFSPWNLPQFLVPKEDDTFRSVIDFKRVNGLILPDHYPLPVLTDFLQPIGKGNTVFYQVCQVSKSLR